MAEVSVVEAEMPVVDLVEGRGDHQLLDQNPAYEEIVVEDRSALVVQPYPPLVRRLFVDERLECPNEPAEGLLEELLPGLAAALLEGVVEGPSAHLNVLVGEHAIGQFEVGLDGFLDEGLRVIPVGRADLGEVGVDELRPVELVGLQRALLVGEPCAAHEVVDHHLVQDDLVAADVLDQLRKDEQQFHLA